MFPRCGLFWGMLSHLDSHFLSLANFLCIAHSFQIFSTNHQTHNFTIIRLFDQALTDIVATTHHNDAISDGEDILHIMTDENNWYPPLAQGANELQDLDLFRNAKSCRWLVHIATA